MKKAIAILLLLFAAFYVLPCGKSIFKKEAAAAAYADTNADDGDNTMKDTGKEFLSSPAILPLQAFLPCKHSIALPHKTAMICCTVLTPPPDRA